MFLCLLHVPLRFTCSYHSSACYARRLLSKLPRLRGFPRLSKLSRLSRLSRLLSIAHFVGSEDFVSYSQGSLRSPWATRFRPFGALNRNPFFLRNPRLILFRTCGAQRRQGCLRSQCAMPTSHNPTIPVFLDFQLSSR